MLRDLLLVVVVSMMGGGLLRKLALLSRRCVLRRRVMVMKVRGDAIIDFYSADCKEFRFEFSSVK